jgi:acetyl esterase/lipase
MKNLGIWLLAGAVFFLSLWIVLPGPTFFFLRLAVVAPEISPWLAIAASALLVITLVTAKQAQPRQAQPRQAQERATKTAQPALILILLIAIALSSSPLLRLPAAVAQADQSLNAAFALNQATASQRPAPPFSWQYFFKGMPRAETRHLGPIQFAAPAGQPLFLEVYQPRLPGRYPAVITIYGGSWQQGSPAASAQIGPYLAARGYVVVAIDYRHAPQYRFPAQPEDVNTALAFVGNHTTDYEIDPQRVGLLGWSAGGHLALLAGLQPAAEDLPPIRSIVDYYGPVDLLNGYNDPPVPDPVNTKQVLRTFLGGTPEQLPAAYRQASPITYADGAAGTLPPVLLIYGGRDHLVEARFGRRLYDRLQASGNTAVWVKIPWAEHAFDKIFNGVSNQMALHYIEPFLQQTLAVDYGANVGS